MLCEPEIGGRLRKKKELADKSKHQNRPNWSMSAKEGKRNK